MGIEERLKFPSPPSVLTRLASGSGLMKGSASRLRDMVASKRKPQRIDCRDLELEDRIDRIRGLGDEVEGGSERSGWWRSRLRVRLSRA